jgi:hypothetical protein
MVEPDVSVGDLPEVLAIGIPLISSRRSASSLAPGKISFNAASSRAVRLVFSNVGHAS